MGEATFINQENTHRQRRNINLGHFSLDLILLAVTSALILFGFLMIYSASPLSAALMDRTPDYFVKRQMLWAGLGVVGVIGMLLIDYHWLRRISVILMFVTLAALFFVELIATPTLGADRSLFGASVRPSELAKLVTIIYVAVWLDAKREVLNDITLGLIPLVGILAITGVLIIVQPDLSAGLTIVVLGGLLFFLAGGEWRQIAMVIVVTLLLGWLLVSIYPTGMIRVTTFISGIQDPAQASEHIRHSFAAIINGGIFGTGIGQGSAKYIGLPVAHTDSIFAVIAEETGLVGVSVLISAYLVILWRGLHIARNAPDSFGRLLASGITFWILLEAFLNIGVMVNLLPNAGNALPFISYGGSSLLVTMIGVGILLSISRTANQKQVEGENTFGTVVDLRWRDRRRSVSRTGRPAGSR
jgi:cell division protein FtsW